MANSSFKMLKDIQIFRGQLTSLGDADGPRLKYRAAWYTRAPFIAIDVVAPLDSTRVVVYVSYYCENNLFQRLIIIVMVGWRKLTTAHTLHHHHLLLLLLLLLKDINETKRKTKLTWRQLYQFQTATNCRPRKKRRFRPKGWPHFCAPPSAYTQRPWQSTRCFFSCRQPKRRQPWSNPRFFFYLLKAKKKIPHVFFFSLKEITIFWNEPRFAHIFLRQRPPQGLGLEHFFLWRDSRDFGEFLMAMARSRNCCVTKGPSAERSRAEPEVGEPFDYSRHDEVMWFSFLVKNDYYWNKKRRRRS